MKAEQIARVYKEFPEATFFALDKIIKGEELEALLSSITAANNIHNFIAADSIPRDPRALAAASKFVAKQKTINRICFSMSNLQQ